MTRRPVKKTDGLVRQESHRREVQHIRHMLNHFCPRPVALLALAVLKLVVRPKRANVVLVERVDITIRLRLGRVTSCVLGCRDAAALTPQILHLVDVILVTGDEPHVVDDGTGDHDAGPVSLLFEPVQTGRDPRVPLAVVPLVDALVFVAKTTLSSARSDTLACSLPSFSGPQEARRVSP